MIPFLSSMAHRFVSSVLAAVVAAVAVSCSDGRPAPTEADLSAFGSYVYELDSAQIERSVWSSRMGVSSDADSLLAVLRREVPRAGLDTTVFFIPEIAADLDIVHQLAFDSVGVHINELLQRLDDHLSQAYIRYTTGQRYGFVRPDRLFNNLDTKVEGGYARLFDYEVKVPGYQEAERHLTQDDRIAYLLASQPQSALYRSLQACLDTTTHVERRRTLAVNMERCRWQIEQPVASGRRIIVNIPAQQLWALGGDSVLDMRICCGAFPTKTPLLHSAITHLQVNPVWIIPQNIIKTEVAPHAGDSAYFARHHYDIIDCSSGDTLNPRSVTASQLKSGRLRVSQRGGVGNSLGRIVFRFPNAFSVYLHDTSNRSAFQRERRTLSHGCVRVQKPFDLASFMMPEADEWLLDRLRISMDIPPKGTRGRDYLKEHAEDPLPHRLLVYRDITPRVPLFIIYYTVFPNPSTGILEFYPDLYNYDALIARSTSVFCK